MCSAHCFPYSPRPRGSPLAKAARPARRRLQSPQAYNVSVLRYRQRSSSALLHRFSFAHTYTAGLWLRLRALRQRRSGSPLGHCGQAMYGAAMPMGAFPMQAWPPHLMPPGFPVDMGAGMGAVSGDNSVLKLKGLPFSATAQDVTTFFEGFALLSCTIHHGADGRPSGMVRPAFVWATTSETLSTCAGLCRVQHARRGAARPEQQGPRLHRRAFCAHFAGGALRGA